MSTHNPWFTHLKGAAHWIWAPTLQNNLRAGRTDLVLFHGILNPPPAAARIQLHISAEGRYSLWLNDQPDPLGRGPARTDIQHRSLDRYDLEINPESTPESLHLWAQVRWFAGLDEAPMAESFAALQGFLCIALFLDSAGQIIGRSGSDKSWLAARSQAIESQPMQHNTFYCIGQSEVHRASGWPADWRTAQPPQQPSDRWSPAEAPATPHFKRDPDEPWSPNGRACLIPREIAPTEERPLPIRDLAILRANPPRLESIPTATGLKLAPHEQLTLRCELGALAIAYLRLGLRGKGSTATIECAEVLYDPATSQKSFALDSLLPLRGFADSFHLDTDAFTFETHHWRTARFLELSLTAGPDGATLERLELLATGYPFEPDFHFDTTSPADAPVLQDEIRKFVDVSWRTLKCCTWETYMDCPFYEQMQYVGDTRIQCLITYVTTGDPTLPAQALRAFDRSRIYEGLTQSRYPSTGPQFIPTFSLIYILMIEDYLDHVGPDAGGELVAELRPGIAPILNWFTRYTDPDTGLIGLVPYWPFVDWVEGWDKGIPPHSPAPLGGEPGPNAAVNLFYLLALQSAARIYDAAKTGSGNFYAARATALKQKIYDAFYDPARELLCDIPLAEARNQPGIWSQHAQALAVLSETLTATAARRAMEIALDPARIAAPGPKTRSPQAAADVLATRQDNQSIAPASFYFRFYIAEALAKLRMGDHLWPLLTPFRDALARGSTTWPEAFEPARSECHAWSSWPLYFFARHLLGIAPPSREDQKIRVRPLHCPPLNTVEGHFQTHRGPVSVQLDWTAQQKPQVTGPGVQLVES